MRDEKYSYKVDYYVLTKCDFTTPNSLIHMYIKSKIEPIRQFAQRAKGGEKRDTRCD